ncbi:MAG TPA: hypothetical protein VFA15_02200, partial [Nitrososphaera sp.]|nr:hypothetical protein [Nitrososphaera sp.]
HRGCKGFGYDTEAAKAASQKLNEQIERVYGRQKRVVHPIVVGIETDEEGLIFHGEAGGTLDMAQRADASSQQLLHELAALYPSMERQTLEDLVPLVEGNQRHVAEIRGAHRPPIELDHREQIIAVGRGFDWLHVPNRALIVGPYDHDWPSAVATAGGIVLDNLKQGRIPKAQNALLLVSSLSRDIKGSHTWNTAVEKARYLEKVARAVLEERVPELTPQLSVLSGVLDMHTRLFHRI